MKRFQSGFSLNGSHLVRSPDAGYCLSVELGLLSVARHFGLAYIGGPGTCDCRIHLLLEVDVRGLRKLSVGNHGKYYEKTTSK